MACDEGRVVPTGTQPGVRRDAGTSTPADAAQQAALDDAGLDAQPSADAQAGLDALAPGLDARPNPDAQGGFPDAAINPGGILLARDITLEHVALFQTVRIALVDNGTEPRPRNGPVIAERDALVRLYVRPGAGWTRRDVTGVLVINGVEHRETVSIGGVSAEGQASTLFGFDVPGNEIREGVTWSAWLENAGGAMVAAGVADNARWPRAGGTTALRAQNDGGGLKLVLVPIEYATDGSNRLPDTSAAQLARYRGLLEALYPIAHLDLTVHTPVRWTRGLTLSGNFNFGAANDMLIDLRVTDRVADDVYYYALVAPDTSFNTYCGGGCVTGQSYVPEDPTDGELRVGSGVGFTGDDSGWTMIHEVGHTHGRFHAPCDVDGWDADYPYTNGDVGVWGYDARDGSLVAPNIGFSDFMGYCNDQWVSDYTYAAIFERIIEQRGGTVIRREIPWLARAVTIDPQSGIAVAEPVRFWKHRPSGPSAMVTFLDPLGRVIGMGDATRLTRSHETDQRWVIGDPPGRAVRARIAGVGVVEL